MALYVIGDRSHPITDTPHPLLFDGWKSRLEALEIQAIHVALDRLVRNTKRSEICTTSWMPSELSSMGHYDWEASPLMKIWDKACERDRARACWCFGLFLFEHMIRRPEAWHFKTADLDNVPMAATRYYRFQRSMGESRDRADVVSV